MLPMCQQENVMYITMMFVQSRFKRKTKDYTRDKLIEMSIKIKRKCIPTNKNKSNKYKKKEPKPIWVIFLEF